MLDIVWSGEIVTRAHHGGSASSNSEAERFGRIPADRDRIEHGLEVTVTGANRTFRLYGGGRQKKLSGGSGKDWTCNGFAPVTYLTMPPWPRMRGG